MLWLIGYYDAAGHPSGKHVLGVGGYISAIPKWLRLERKWRATLDAAGIDVFHMTDFMACQGMFAAWRGREAERNELLLELVKLTKTHVRKGFATFIELNAWNAVNEQYQLKECHCRPYGLCGFFTMDKTMRYLHRRKESFHARFVFENGDEDKGDFMWMMDQLVRKNRKLFGGISPSFEGKDLAPLQVADLAMWEAVFLAKDRLRNPDTPPTFRETFHELVKIPHEWGVIDEQMLVKFCVDFSVPKGGESLGAWSPFRSFPRSAPVEHK